MGRVAIVGVGHSKFGKRTDASLRELAFEAYSSALDDAELESPAIDGSIRSEERRVGKEWRAGGATKARKKRVVQRKGRTTMPLPVQTTTEGRGMVAAARASFGTYFCSSRRRHTRCYRDWSSDVCSSDLGVGHSKFGKRTDASLRELAFEAYSSALDDAELESPAIDGSI